MTGGNGRRPAEVPQPDCWLHPDVEVRASPIAGLGLFATGRIAADVVVSRLGGRLVSGEQLRQELADAAGHPPRPYVDTITVGDDLHLVLPPRRVDGPGPPDSDRWAQANYPWAQANGYGNHSCDPNLWWVSAYELAARRPIRPGDELTSDYATSTAGPDFAMTCFCGSALCRGVVTGDDWRRPELRERYGRHWVPALLRRICSA